MWAFWSYYINNIYTSFQYKILLSVWKIEWKCHSQNETYILKKKKKTVPLD